jgi:hypothetical protein
LAKVGGLDGAAVIVLQKSNTVCPARKAVGVQAQAVIVSRLALVDA